MTYPTSSNLTAFTEYLAASIMKEIGKTPIVKHLFEEIQAMMPGVIHNGMDAFCGGASPTGLRYEVSVIADDANKPVIFEGWSVSTIREHMEQDGWTSEDLPTLFSIDDDHFRELLERCASKGYSFYSYEDGLLIMELEDIAEDYFK